MSLEGKRLAKHDWYKDLVCPSCKEPVPQDPEGCCDHCGAIMQHRKKVWWFVEDQQGDRARLSTPDGAAMVAGYRQPSQWKQKLRKVISSEYFPGKAWRKAKQTVLDQQGSVLVIGSGVTHYPGAIHLDLDDFPGVDIVADAHALPFRDQSINGVICEVVLEHAYSAQTIIEEAKRILKPGGRLFFVVPFLFPYHGHPSDYRRWSKEGLVRDFSPLDELEVGIMGGPCSSMVNLISEWAYVLTGLTFPKGYTLVKGGVTAALFPLKFLDWWVNRFPEAHRLASTLYITGTKPTA